MAGPYNYGTDYGQSPATATGSGNSGFARAFIGNTGQNAADFYNANPYAPQLQYGYQQGMQGIQDRATPQLDPTQQAQFRQMQMQQAQQLQRIASGQQQGAGELAAQRQVQNALAAQQAQAHMARGGNSALAMRGAANNSAGIGMSGAGMSQQAALQDQQMAQGQLTGALGQGRGQDIGFAGQNAQLTQQMYGQNDQARLGYLNMLSNTGQGALSTGTQNYGIGSQEKGVGGGLISSLGTVMGAAAASDERLKTDVSDAGDDIDDMLNKLTAKTYRYKDESKYGEGPRAGIMAQDLERSKAGKAIVVDLPDNSGMKGFDVGKAVSAALAATARLNARLRKLEAPSG